MGRTDDPQKFYVEDDEKQFWKKTKFMLLHPLEHNKSLKMKESGQYVDSKSWFVQEVTNAFYHSEEKSAIMLGIFNK